ncbi:PREDICTED: E3 ubiquitin-protein ligase BAH1 isoform X2 [Tarenaya hassleriana]|uniref:E3 ubiquitin-protein ligase BAH1 isoform X2 n=1 Tax=Tarenaya hassleriana TaxID=28532 RepID=UPI00053C9230|nr:PREDICTED: E3 ubiquitin-protein ligase BAH1 isoform X2 [Tarenaya hassleriana]
MKFCKKYEEYMQGQERKNLPGVGFKNLKKILKKCRRDFSAPMDLSEALDRRENCPRQCPVCDGTFFPELLREMEKVVGWFNENARKLLELHLASGFRKYLIWFKGDHRQRNHMALIQEGKDLVSYALINAVAIRKILKKYDKIHESKQGQEFKTKVQRMHIEILQSPWLCELMAFHINLRETQKKSGSEHSTHPSALFKGCSLMFNDGKPFLSCELFDSVKVDIDLTCSICLDTVFDPVSLTCGHIFCYMCACSAASVSVIDGLKSAEPTEKCPLCREVHVYEGAVHLDELSILLRRRGYWEERRRTERAERIQQAKEYWDLQCRTFMGI